MKYLKEIIYLCKNAGFANAFVYIGYRLKLKWHDSKFATKLREQQKLRLEKISEHLFIFNNNKVTIEGRTLIEFKDKNRTFYIRPFSSDRKVCFQIFHRDEYKSLVNIYNQLFAGPAQLIIDLGANIGLTSIYLSEFYPNASIVAIEPFLESADIAEINLSRHQTKFKIIRGGAWNKNTSLSLKRDFRDGKEWSINLFENINGDIKGYSLFELLNQYKQNIDILKIDIEGGEKILFEDECYVNSFLKNVKCIAIEIHDEFECRETIYKFLKQNGFIYFESGETTIGINKNFINYSGDLNYNGDLIDSKRENN